VSEIRLHTNEPREGERPETQSHQYTESFAVEQLGKLFSSMIYNSDRMEVA
jgi:hypothetical protein